MCISPYIAHWPSLHWRAIPGGITGGVVDINLCGHGRLVADGHSGWPPMGDDRPLRPAADHRVRRLWGHCPLFNEAVISNAIDWRSAVGRQSEHCLYQAYITERHCSTREAVKHNGNGRLLRNLCWQVLGCLPVGFICAWAIVSTSRTCWNPMRFALLTQQQFNT